MNGHRVIRKDRHKVSRRMEVLFGHTWPMVGEWWVMSGDQVFVCTGIWRNEGEVYFSWARVRDQRALH